MVSTAFAVAWGLVLIAAFGFAGIKLQVKGREEFPAHKSFLAAAV